MKSVGKLKTENGAWIIEDEKNQCLSYRRRRQATIYKVRYTIGDDEYIFETIVKSGGSYLAEEQGLPIVNEIIEQLKRKGFTVSHHGSEF